MEEKKIEVIRSWSEPKSVRDIQAFLGFANFYRIFIINFNKITTLLISMLQATSDNDINTQADQLDKNQNTSKGAGGGIISGDSSESIKNLSTFANFSKFKK